ncbi:uncharacterized protein BP5553_02449 [Venustampulla echinocandica]|uniref:Zn(2)-C6 fungal-type domain-containing protein n=1 Tax=Venustampulla echinocandica TaxID=2656787 RepID=A0A370U3V9_9HELO|nr:uncharacterized protein BP5553_02449 [Venustampulla echinocandica]RDL42470.1 hypothetical protein BP5553_02449 [Venustampulla echinocandica]
MASMSMYGAPNPSPNAHIAAPKASKACYTCRNQKRKCDKVLPACSLCLRMNRSCDYSDPQPTPTSEDLHVLQAKIAELESQLESHINGGRGLVNHAPLFGTPSSLSGVEALGHSAAGYSEQWGAVPNRFPAIAFLDKKAFLSGGIDIPKPPVNIPDDVLEHMRDGLTVTAIAEQYAATVHRWMPILSRKYLLQEPTDVPWDGGSDAALLYLCMKLVASRLPDGVESFRAPLYLTAKRFASVLDLNGAASLQRLQANLLIVWYEYGHAIYPAAWMTAGWCVRYGNLLGINGHHEAMQLLGRPTTWIEQEERNRTWWGVQVANRIVSYASQGYIMDSQEPRPDAALPADDDAWNRGELSAPTALLSSPIDDPVGPFSRLCQASIMMGKVLSHHYHNTFPSEAARLTQVSKLSEDILDLSGKITEETNRSPDFLSLSAPLALLSRAFCILCDPYSGLDGYGLDPSTPQAAEMQQRAAEGLKTLSGNMYGFGQKVEISTSGFQDLDSVNPIIMDALYSAALNFAWFVRKSGDMQCQTSLDEIRNWLTKLGARWRSAAEYARLLEAQEFSYAIRGAGP